MSGNGSRRITLILVRYLRARRLLRGFGFLYFNSENIS